MLNDYFVFGYIKRYYTREEISIIESFGCIVVNYTIIKKDKNGKDRKVKHGLIKGINTGCVDNMLKQIEVLKAIRPPMHKIGKRKITIPINIKAKDIIRIIEVALKENLIKFDLKLKTGYQFQFENNEIILNK